MEKGKLIITKSSAGFYAQVVIENNKIHINDFKVNLEHLNLSNKLVDIELSTDRKKVLKIISNNVLIYEFKEKVEQKNISNNKPFISAKKFEKKEFSENKREEKQYKKNNNQIKEDNEQAVGSAEAPYNFISLNKDPINQEKILPQDKYYGERYTGYIQLHIKNRTPIYIRDTFNQNEIDNDNNYKKKDSRNKYINSDFYSPTGKKAIPGSSIRGMFRTLLEVVSFSHFRFFNNSRLYYRALADVTDLKKEYTDRMSSFDRSTKKSQYKMNAGLMFFENNSYFIIPIGGHGTGFYNINKEKSKPILQTLGRNYGQFRFFKITQEDVNNTSIPQKLANTYIVVSGDMKNKKNDWVVDLKLRKDLEKFEISEDDVEDYKNDKNRNSLDLLAYVRKHKEVPCFYTNYKYKDEEGKEHDKIAFGHTPLFRLSYEKRIGDHIHKQLQIEPEIKNDFSEINHLDYADSIFGFTRNKQTKEGYISSLAGRVNFTDAILSFDCKEKGESIPEVLGEPKPTTFQHYLEQKEIKEDGSIEIKKQESVFIKGKDIRQRANYNTNTNIRGYKFYWHRPNAKWEDSSYKEKGYSSEQMLKLIKEYNNLTEEKKVEHDSKIRAEIEKTTGKKNQRLHLSQKTIIQPILPGAIFEGKIYFENLSSEELGSLLFILNLPESCYYKLGTGKPYGLGTVEIQSEVYISERKERYSSLKTEWKSALYKKMEVFEMNRHIESFANKMLQQIYTQEEMKTVTDSKNELWKIPRLHQLLLMLKEHIDAEDQKKFRNMSMEEKEFSKRNILSPPEHYIKGNHS